MVKLSNLFSYYINTYSAWADPVSLAATSRISVDFFSYRYLDVSVPRVRLITLYIQIMITALLQLGSPMRTPPDHRSFAS